MVGRVTTFLIGLIPVWDRLVRGRSRGQQEAVRKMVTVFSVAAPPIAIPMLAGIVWHRASNKGAIAGFLAGVCNGLCVFFKESIKTLIVEAASLDSGSFPASCNRRMPHRAHAGLQHGDRDGEP